MGRRTTAATLSALALSGAFAGCATTAPPEAVAPEVRRAEVTKIEVTEQAFTDFKGVVHLAVDPGNVAGLVANASTLEIRLKDAVVFEGRVELGTPLAAGDNELLLPFTAPYAPSDEALAAILADPKALPGFYQGTVEASVAGKQVEFTWSHAQHVRAPRTPRLKMYHVEAGKFREQKEIALVFFVDVENPNPFDVHLQQIDYDLFVGPKPLVKAGAAAKNTKVPAGSVVRVEIPLTLDRDNYPDVERLIKMPSAVDYRLEGNARLGLGHIPFELAGPIDLGAGTVRHATED